MDTERRIKSKIGSQTGGAEVAPSLKIGGGKASIDTTLTAGWQETCNLSHFTTIQSIFCCYSNIEQILNTHSLAATRHCNFCFFPQSLLVLAAKKDLSLLRFKLRICLLKCSVQIIDILRELVLDLILHLINHTEHQTLPRAIWPLARGWR